MNREGPVVAVRCHRPFAQKDLAMPTIQIQTPHPIDFEAFPQGCPRSVRGALRLMPGDTREITAGELAALQLAGVQLRVLAAPADPPVQALPLPADQDETPRAPSQARKKPRKG